MEGDPGLLLSLLAVRLLGGQSVDEKAPLLKAYKAQLAQAVEKAYLKKGKVKIATTNPKTGKAGSKQLAVLDLAEAGEEFLRQAASSESFAATSSGRWNALHQALESDRQQLKQAAQAALQGSTKGPDETKVQKEVTALEKKVADLAKQLGSLNSQAKTSLLASEKKVSEMAEQLTTLRSQAETSLISSEQKVSDLAAQLTKLESVVLGTAGNSGMLANLDEVYGNLKTRIDQALKAMPSASATGPAPAAVLSLKTVLHQAYDKLCLFVEFKDGLVELPRLYHEAKRTLPNLTIDAFQHELRTLWEQRALQLHILNEEHKAAEPDKAIRQGDKLYYFVLWKRP